MFYYLALLLAFVVNLCFCVPPSPTDSLLADVSSIKVSLDFFADVFDKWSSMYNNQVEPRMVSSSNILAAMDSNIKNLQERAHVWDTFQLHISAWNDQLATTDRKLDIISKAQEKLFNLDAKLNSVNNLDYKLDSVLKKLQEIEESLNDIPKRIDEKRQGETLFGEFATRGILSTLKLIERKLDKVHLTGQNLVLKQNRNEELKNRIVKCNTPAGLEEILRDISSKVDVMFDKISEKDEVITNENDDYFDDQQIGSGDASDDLKSDSDVRLLRKLLRRVSLPCKQTGIVLDDIMAKVKEIEGNTGMIIKRNGRNCKSSGQTSLDVDKIAGNITQLRTDLQVSLNSHFSEQRAHFNTILKTNLMKNCLYKPLEVPIPRFSSSTTEYYALNVTEPSTSTEYGTELVLVLLGALPFTPYEIELAESVSSCEELPIDAKSGVYNFTDAEDFKLRFCHEHWTIIQRRDNYVDLQNFSQPWVDYKFGFGDVGKDFWMGNEFIHKMSTKKNLSLRVELEDFDGNTVWAQYNFFQVSSERDNYKLFVGGYSGNASDSLSSHSNSSFSTYDKKNDAAPSCCPCSSSYGGGWWFNSCFEANLNGVYHRTPHTNEYFRGIIWEHWLGNYSLKRTLMMVKPKPENVGTTDENTTLSTFFPFIEDP